MAGCCYQGSRSQGYRHCTVNDINLKLVANHVLRVCLLHRLIRSHYNQLFHSDATPLSVPSGERSNQPLSVTASKFLCTSERIIPDQHIIFLWLENESTTSEWKLVRRWIFHTPCRFWEPWHLHPKRCTIEGIFVFCDGFHWYKSKFQNRDGKENRFRRLASDWLKSILFLHLDSDVKVQWRWPQVSKQRGVVPQ